HRDKRSPRLFDCPRAALIRLVLASLVEHGGPLLYHSDSEERQRSFDSTCRKFRRFLTESVVDPRNNPPIPPTRPFKLGARVVWNLRHHHPYNGCGCSSWPEGCRTPRVGRRSRRA